LRRLSPAWLVLNSIQTGALAMNIVSALKQGLALNQKNIKIVPLIYAVNFFLALIFAVPFFVGLHQSIGDLGVRNDLLQGFSLEWWSAIELDADGLLVTLRPALASGYGALFDNAQLLLTGGFKSFGWWILAFGVLYLVVSVFLNGGAIALYADEKRTFSSSRFFSSAGYYFHHFVAITATAILLYFILYKVISPVILNSVAGWTALSSPRVVWWMNFAVFLVILVIVLLLNLIMDYAKIILVVEKKNSAWMAIASAAKFAATHLWGTTGLYLLLSILAIVISLAFAGLLTVLHPSDVIVLFIVFSVQQAFIFAKIWMRLNYYTAQLSYYSDAQTNVRKLRKV